MASQTHEIVLITGGNTGIGFQIAKKMLSEHSERFFVFIASRTPSKGEAAVQALHDQGFTACEFVQLEVTDNESITKAAKTVEQKYGKLDVLIVNAAIAADRNYLPAGKPIADLIKHTFATNVAGAAQSVETFIPLLEKGENSRVVFMSSTLSSLSWVAAKRFPVSEYPAYAASKTALNMIVLWYCNRFPQWKVNACCPGYRHTALNDFNHSNDPGVADPNQVALGAVNPVRLALLGKDGETGTFTKINDETGRPEAVPW